MKNFLLSVFTKIFQKRNTRKAKIEMLQVEILRLRHIIEKIEKNYSDVSFIVKNQSELLSTIAEIQSEMIGTFVLGTSSGQSSKKKTSKVGNILILPPEDDDMVN